MMAFFYKWLPIFFGCHCRKDRSFHIRGKQFPICARCTGELFGMIVCAFTYAIWRPYIWVCFLMMIPLVIDGFCQRLTAYESTNGRRFWTGVLFGYAFLFIILWSIGLTYRAGFYTFKIIKGIP